MRLAHTLAGRCASPKPSSPASAQIQRQLLGRINSRCTAPLAAAAGIVLAWIVWPGGGPVDQPAGLPVAAVEAGFIRTYESPSFSLDMTKAEHQKLFAHLKERSLPCPGCLPPGLRDVPGIGCRELIIEGKRGAILCFDQREAGKIHLLCDGERLLPETDPFGRQILIGCGAFLELAVIAAAQRGLAVQVDLFPEGPPAANALPAAVLPDGPS